MRAKEYQLIEQCVENGIEYGYNRAFKHTDAPTPDQIKAHIADAVMLEISEWFEFPLYVDKE